MTKIVLSSINSLTNEPAALALFNGNSGILVAAFDNTLSRDGTTPNTMSANIDMNGNRLLNLPQAVNPTDPVRLQEIGNSSADATAAAASAAAALVSQNSAATSATTSSTGATTATTQAGIATTQAGTATTQAGIATTQAGNALASATAAAATEASLVLGLSDSSTTSNAVGTGAKTFTISSGKLYTAGQFLIITNTGTPTNYMHGTVTSYTGTSLVMSITDTGGAGTFTAWTINLSGTQGPAGTGSISGATANGVAYATGATSLTSTVALTNGQVIVGVTSSAPIPVTLTGDITLSAAGVTAIKTSVVLTTPNIGVATATSVNGNTITAGTGTLTLGSGTLNTGVGGTITGSSSAAILYDNIPQNSQSTAYTLVLADAQKHIYHPSADTTARIFTIPANASVAYPIGTVISIVNDTSAGVVTIAITTDTLVWMGAGTTGSRALAANGWATIMKVTATRWVISGTGLT